MSSFSFPVCIYCCTGGAGVRQPAAGLPAAEAGRGLHRLLRQGQGRQEPYHQVGGGGGAGAGAVGAGAGVGAGAEQLIYVCTLE